ncbi:MCE family protein [Nocardioides daejeonensis]|uniref:MCE family protein n=1 Tax=Nocardioides daejeonensis TaxID=1046556 RepID=UPI000D74D77D|nr:MCE family protein [Nocardioides daejeonensis]
MSLRPTLRLCLALALLGLVVVLLRVTADPELYRADLPHAGGIRAGDTVRIAGLDAGKVRRVWADRDTVHVEFSLTEGRLTDDTVVEVKLESLLGKRYLSLTPGKGKPLSSGATLARSQARDPFTVEEFWLEAAPTVQGLDLPVMERALDVLTEDLATAPADVRAALTGLSDLADLADRRDEQVTRLVATTRSVTATVLDQQDEIEDLMDDASLVLRMVHERREALRLLLRDSRRLSGRLTALARRTRPEIEPALRQLRTVFGVLRKHERELSEVLRLAGPTMRVYTNAAGDGPWLGVNAPWFVLPDDFWCTLTPKGCR